MNDLLSKRMGRLVLLAHRKANRGNLLICHALHFQSALNLTQRVHTHCLILFSETITWSLELFPLQMGPLKFSEVKRVVQGHTGHQQVHCVHVIDRPMRKQSQHQVNMCKATSISKTKRSWIVISEMVKVELYNFN